MKALSVLTAALLGHGAMCAIILISHNAPSPSLNHQKLYATFRLPVGDVLR